jgi:hypothetical protein
MAGDDAMDDEALTMRLGREAERAAILSRLKAMPARIAERTPGAMSPDGLRALEAALNGAASRFWAERH